MLILLPPSESKRDGGDPGTRLRLDGLGWPELSPQREAALGALTALSADPDAAAAALRLGPTQRGEVQRNRRVSSSPTMAALDRFEGVLFDGLDAASLPSHARAFAGDRVAIASALFGLVRATDPIPAYRLSADSRLPDLPLKRLWREPLHAALSRHPGLIVDLRSQGYVELGPPPVRDDSVAVRVVTEDPVGRRRALNHFNKKAKGELVRALLLAGIDHPGVESLLEWAREAGIRLERTGSGRLDLVV